MPGDRSRADYEQLASIAKSWQAESDNASAMLRALQQHVERARGGAWVGKAASAFLAEMDGTVTPSLKRLIAALAEASNATKQISTEFKTAEDAAANALREDRTIQPGQPGAATSPDAGGGNDGGGFLSQVGGFFEGLWEGGKDMVTGLWQAVTNPIDTLKGLAYAITHPGELWEALKKPYVDDWNSGNYGRAIGRGTFEVLSMLFPPGGGAAAKGVTKGADIAGDMGRIAKLADTASDVARGADKASDMARAADRASDASRLIDDVADGGRGGTIADTGALAGKGPEPFMFPAAKEAGRGAELVDSAGRTVEAMDPFFGRSATVDAANDAAKRMFDPATDAATKQVLLDDIARASTHGSGDTVVLGPWERPAVKGKMPNWLGEYGLEAQSNGGRYFQTPDGLYGEFKAAGGDIFEVNKRFLDQQLTDPAVKRIQYVLEDPLDLLDDVTQRGRASWREIDYMQTIGKEAGFVYDVATQSWIRK